MFLHEMPCASGMPVCARVCVVFVLLQVLRRIVSKYGSAETRVLLGLGCRRRGTKEHVGFLQLAAPYFRCRQLHDDYMADVQDMENADTIDLIELIPLPRLWA